MTASAPARSAVRPTDVPFVVVLGVIGVLISSRVAWSARGGALVLLVPPILVGALVVAGTIRVLVDLQAARAMGDRLASFAGNEGASPAGLTQEAKHLIDRASSTLPSICILVGLLGTFAGLFEALVGARDLLGSAVDTAALRQIVVAPLSGLARAFGSSAAGIVGSIVLGAAEGCFQRAADSLAVVVETADDARRASEASAQLRAVLEGAQGSAQEGAERHARLEALLERVAKAAETQAHERASLATALAAIAPSIVEQGRLAIAATTNEAVVTRASFAALDETLRTTQARGVEVVDAASREAAVHLAEVARAVQSQGDRVAAAVQALSASLASERVEALLGDVKRELTANGAAASACSDAVLRALDAQGTSVSAAVDVALARAGESQVATLESILASYKDERASLSQDQERSFGKLEAALDAFSATVARTPEALRSVEHAAKAQFAAADGALRAALVEGTTALTAALREVRDAHVAQQIDATARSEAAARALTAAMQEALTAWQEKDSERYAREDAERKARWDDADAQRSEWSGAEKLILQSAMEMVAERLNAAGAVQERALATVEAAAKTLEAVESSRAVALKDDEARRLATQDGLREALAHGSEVVANVLRREAEALVVASRGEIARAVEGLEAKSVQVVERLESSSEGASQRLASLEAQSEALAKSSADVARAVETLSEVLRAAPLGVTAAPADGSSMGGAVGVSAASDEDRAAFVACLEEARRWFDASQALQQKLIDELTSARGAGGRP